MPILTHEERVGTLLGGKYRLGKILGRGGMGAVFESVHEWTGRAVAVKVLSHEHVENPEAAERFLREARVVAGLKHPNVVDVLDLGEEPDRTVFMVLELLEGESFGRMLYREKALSFERAAEVLVPVMRAVAYAHARNVVHRDIKPENIFLHTDAEGNRIPKILDFGIAKALDEDRDQHVTQTGFVMGTPAYMSPEQGEGIPARIGAPADVWSMGVVWYEALSGALPFEGPTPTSILLAVNAGKFTRLVKRLPTLPVSLANAIDKAIVRDVARRYPDMGAFLDALLKAAAEAGEAMPARGSTPGATRGSRERISPAPQDPEVRVSSTDPPQEMAIELGPVRAMPPVAEITLGDTTDEPVVLLNNPRRKRRKRPVVAIGLTLAALAAAGGVALFATRAPSTPPDARDTPTAAAALQAQLPTPERDARVAPTPSVAPPVAARDDAPDAAVEAQPAPTPSRHGHHGSHGSHAQSEGPAQQPLAQPSPTPAATPTEAPRTADAPPPTADTHGHHSRGDRPSLPRENAPITDYDPAQ